MGSAPSVRAPQASPEARAADGLTSCTPCLWGNRPSGRHATRRPGDHPRPVEGGEAYPYRSCTLSTTSRNFASTPSRFSAFTTPTARR